MWAVRRSARFVAVVVGAAAAVVGLSAPHARAEEPAALPDALPPLDDALVKDEGPIRFFGQARLRGLLDDSRDLSRVEDTAAGVDVTGRVGVDADIDGMKLVVVLGDGGRVGAPSPAPALVDAPAVPVLYQAELAFPTSIAGVPASLDVGRMRVVVGDGRLVGTEPFDARGRTLDGARVRAHTPLVDLALGAFLLGEATPATLTGLFALEAALHPRADVDGDVYGLLHRDPAAPLTLPTAGVRISAAGASWLRLRAGADVQAPVADAARAFTVAGHAGHAELGARAALPSFSGRFPALFVDASGEITAGDTVLDRVFRAPAPTQHGALGLLDLVAMDNTWSAALAAGAEDRGLSLDLCARALGMVDPNGPLLDTGFHALTEKNGTRGGLALVELDALAAIPLAKDVSLGVGYGVGLPGRALIGDQPAQRLFVTLRAQAPASARALPPLE